MSTIPAALGGGLTAEQRVLARRLRNELGAARFLVLGALCCSETRLRAVELESTCGLSAKTIAKALEYLLQIGVLDHTPQGWGVLPPGRDMARLMIGEPVAAAAQVDERVVGKALAAEAAPGVLPPAAGRTRVAQPVAQPASGAQKNGKNSSFFSSPPTTTDSDFKKIKTLKSSSSSVNRAPRRASAQKTTGDPKPTSKPKPVNAEVYQALRKLGVGEPKRSQLARLPEITTQKVEEWEKLLRKRKGANYNPGLLVHVLESGDEQLPTVRTRRDYARWENPCEKCGRMICICNR